LDYIVKSGDDPQVRGDAFKTLFVARLSYDTTEKDLEREFGRFGPIERVGYSSHIEPALHTTNIHV
jgi:U1 small nuclear ribonucleoprotein